jgi:hypothetical protein
MGEFQLDFFRTRQSKGSPKVSNHSKLIDTAGATLVQARSYFAYAKRRNSVSRLFTSMLSLSTACAEFSALVVKELEVIDKEFVERAISSDA